MANFQKAVMVGCGFVGSATVFALMQSGLFSEIVLIDANMEKAEGEAMDISHGIPFSKQQKIYAGTYADVKDAGIVIITAGAAQQPGETRLDLVKKNVGIFKGIVPQIMENGFDGILLVVANPVDVLTKVALDLSGLPENHVIGSGTVLDTGRLKQRLSDHLGVDAKSIHAFIIGEHGDSEIAAWSSANVSGIPLDNFCEMRGHYSHRESQNNIAEDVKNAAYEIISKKRATYYGVAMAVRRICEVIVRDEKAILPVSNLMHGEHGISDIYISMPCIVGRDGIETQVPIVLNEEEVLKLQSSAKVLKGILDEIKL